MNKIMAMLLATALGVCGAQEPYDIGEDLSSEEFWQIAPELFVEQHRTHGFNFTSDAHKGADTRVRFKAFASLASKVSLRCLMASWVS